MRCDKARLYYYAKWMAIHFQLVTAKANQSNCVKLNGTPLFLVIHVTILNITRPDEYTEHVAPV